METRDEQANIANALDIASKSTGTIALGPTINSFLEQVTLKEPILNQSINSINALCPQTNSNISIGL